jgi:uncharacterized protein (TIGR02452 family)
MRANLTKLAEENERLIGAGYYHHPGAGRVSIEAAVRAAGDATRGYQPEELTALLAELGPAAGPAAQRARIEVTGESSLEAASRLATAEGGAGPGTIGVLNFASARNPGGGYLTGARSQEEDLCRCSALYSCLLRVPDYYAAHRASGDPLYSHRVICSPAVPVFRDQHGDLLPTPYPVTFLTCPAPNAGVLAQRDPERLPLIPGVLAERVARVLAVAVRHRVDRLVLGAWGCGVFRNSPEQVATAFADQFGAGGGFAGRFDRIVFGIYEHDPARPTLTTFARVLGHPSPGPADQG